MTTPTVTLTPTAPPAAALTIRPATAADVPRLVALTRRFIATTPYAEAVGDDPPQVAATFTALVANPAALVLAAVADDAVVGMIALVLATHHFSGARTASEVIWWVEPEARGAGVALLRAAERWAAEAGATHIQMIAPATPDGDRVGRLYVRRGYRALETGYQAPVTPAMTALMVVDDVLPDVDAYRAASLRQPFATVTTAPGVVFHGFAPVVDDRLLRAITTRWPTLTPTLTLLRQSPAGQPEPNFIHTDADMGDWSALYYLTADPAPGDGTTFWRWRETGALRSTAAVGSEAYAAEQQAWRDLAQWAPWMLVAARPNRLVVFPSAYYHSRALVDNYGSGDTARLIQVVFGTGAWPPEGVSAWRQ